MGIYIIMGTVFCIFAVGVGLPQYRKRKRGAAIDIGDSVASVFLYSVIAMLPIGSVMFVTSTEEGKIVNGDVSYCEETTTERPIASINRGSQLTGSFFLGTGSIGSRSYYYTYIKEDKGFMLTKYRTSTTHIVETDVGVPKITYNNYACPKPFTSWLLGGTRMRNYTEWNKVFHVPPNTILREFKL